MKSNHSLGRRGFLKHGLTFSALFPASRSLAENTAAPTPQEIEGPFYPLQAQQDQDFDLTQIAGHDQQAAGKAIFIEGSVSDTDGNPVVGATVDLWQANHAGRYRHPHDSNPAPLDPHFQGWAIVPSGQQGGFRFKTIFPGVYPAADGWLRPPHIHFKVSKKGYVELVTQMYFPDQELNQKDLLLKRKTPEEQAAMISKRIHTTPETYQFKITLARA